MRDISGIGVVGKDGDYEAGVALRFISKVGFGLIQPELAGSGRKNGSFRSGGGMEVGT